MLLIWLCEHIYTCPDPHAMDNTTCMKGIHMFHRNIKGLLNFKLLHLKAAFGKYQNTDIFTLLETDFIS